MRKIINIVAIFVCLFCLGGYVLPSSFAADLKPGDVITKGNWQKVESMVQPIGLDEIKRGNYTLKIVDRPLSLPKEFWEERVIKEKVTTAQIQKWADELKIHTALIAGRIRYHTGDYTKLSRHVGNGNVRRQFKEA